MLMLLYIVNVVQQIKENKMVRNVFGVPVRDDDLFGRENIRKEYLFRQSIVKGCLSHLNFVGKREGMFPMASFSGKYFGISALKKHISQEGKRCSNH